MTGRRSLCRLLDVIGVFLLLVAVVSATVEDPAQRRGSLSELLDLDYRQVSRLREITEMEQSQARLDRENFKTNAAALVESARRRRAMVDSHIEEMLTDEQKETFERIKQQRMRQREMFTLTEGLLLTPDQQGQVREILEKNRPDRKGKRPGGFDGPGMGMGRGGMMGGGRGGMRPGGRGGDRFRQKMDEMDSKKAKEIKKLLSPEQRELYKQVRSIQKVERKLRHH
jgi:hypothetical protein